MNHFEWSWDSKGRKVYAQGWSPASCKGVVCLVHGFAEFSDRYEHVAKFLGEHGFSTLTFDQLGHGKTEGKRGHADYEDMLDNVKVLLHEADTRFPGLPNFLYGHSMGGNIVANYLLRRDVKDVKAAVITGPLFKLGFEPPAIKVLLAKIMVNIYPKFTEKSELDADAISRDKDEVRKYKNHPMTLNVITAGMFLGFFNAAKYALEHANDLSTPLLVMHGTADRLTSHKGSEEFARKNTNGLVTLKLWDGFYHELHNEPAEDRKQVLEYLVTYLKRFLKD